MNGFPKIVQPGFRPMADVVSLTFRVVQSLHMSQRSKEVESHSRVDIQLVNTNVAATIL